jgi:hypothetical protein
MDSHLWSPRQGRYVTPAPKISIRLFYGTNAKRHGSFKLKGHCGCFWETTAPENKTRSISQKGASYGRGRASSRGGKWLCNNVLKMPGKGPEDERTDVRPRIGHVGCPAFCRKAWMLVESECRRGDNAWTGARDGSVLGVRNDRLERETLFEYDFNAYRPRYALKTAHSRFRAYFGPDGGSSWRTHVGK